VIKIDIAKGGLEENGLQKKEQIATFLEAGGKGAHEVQWVGGEGGTERRGDLRVLEFEEVRGVEIGKGSGPPKRYEQGGNM